jgi:DNA gyrase/topoisomerase IV subunit A
MRVCRAEAGVLGNLLQALHRDKFKYVFSPVWFDKADMEQATFDDRDRQQQAILKQHEDELKKAEADKLEQERRRKQEQQKTEIERRLREQNSVKARGLVNEIQELAQNLAENRVVNNHFPAYSNWLNQRFADQWETFQVTSDVADFGTVQWQGRTLEAIMVKSVIQQKNRILGRYSRDCFEFGFINDVEFAMERELFSVDCDKGKDFVKKWSIGNQFKSQWNVE